jgi:hypothetical protein
VRPVPRWSEPYVRAGHALVAQLNSLVAEGSSIAFAFGTPTDPGPARRQLSMLADADGDWQLRRRFDHPEVDEEEVIVGSLGALIAQALSEPEFRWSAVEQAIGLASPAGAFRAEVAEALRFCVLLQMSGPTKRFSELRKNWAGIAARADAAAAAVRDLRAALVQLPGWTNDVARQLLEPVEMPLFAWAFIARRQTNLIPKGPGGRPPMRVFFCLVFLLAAAFESATGRKAAVTRNGACYEGPFLALVEAVLSRLSNILREVGSPALVEPNSSEARGKFIVRFLRRDKTPAAER